VCPTASVLASLVGRRNRALEYFRWLSDLSKPLRFPKSAMRKFDPDLEDLISHMLVKDPNERSVTFLSGSKRLALPTKIRKELASDLKTVIGNEAAGTRARAATHVLLMEAAASLVATAKNK
ncbi:hypothetical protein FOL47_003674, partial [Perkinsus chesapeaki]